jgi:hypothetical protein
MRREGEIAKQIKNMIILTRLKYFKNKSMPKLNIELHLTYKDGELRIV